MLRRRRPLPEPGFKDYYLILQVHPEADAAMIDAAYWHLARRYGEERLTDSSARAMMDELNEAYGVLRSAERRDDYNRLRDIVLGAKALPTAPQRPSDPLPLAVMERQRPQAREDVPGGPQVRRRWGAGRLTDWSSFLSAGFLFSLAVVALVWAQPVLVVVLFAIGVALTLLPAARRAPGALKPPRPPKGRSGPPGGTRRRWPRIPLGRRANAADLRRSTEDAVERLRNAPHMAVATSAPNEAPQSES